MIIFPAVDIQGGKAVRLARGKKDKATIFADDPVTLARHWQDQGAEWLHIIDLDGAFDGSSVNLDIISRIASETGLPCQVGGGIRNAETAGIYLDCGVERLIIGTIALEKPAEFADMCSRYPGKIGISLDAENGRLKSRGWERDCEVTLEEMLGRVATAGAAFVIYTDIARDGMKTGPNLPALEILLKKTELPVLVAGGISSMRDIEDVYALSSHTNLQGVVSGRAISDGSLALAEAVAWLKSQANRSRGE